MDASVWVPLGVAGLVVVISSLLFLFRGVMSGDPPHPQSNSQREVVNVEKARRKKKPKAPVSLPHVPSDVARPPSSQPLANTHGQVMSEKRDSDVKKETGSGEKSKSGDKKKRKGKTKEKKEEVSIAGKVEVIAAGEEGEWTETISRRTKREKKAKEQRERLSIKEESEQGRGPADKTDEKKQDNEVLEVAPAEEMGSFTMGSPTRESSGRASAAASTNSNTDSSDFVHIEVRADDEGDVTVEVVDPPVEKRKGKKRTDETETKTEGARDVSDSPMEGLNGTAVKPQRQKRQRKRKVRVDGAGDGEDGEWEIV